MTERFESLNFNDIQAVIDSWEALKRSSPDYEVEVGTVLFSELFSKCPSSALLFGFGVDVDTSRESLKKNSRFKRHAQYMIQMLDKALNLLGPDAELLAEIMGELGKKHVQLGITDDTYYAVMGDALIQALRELLGKSAFTIEMEEAWKVVYGALSGAMVAELDSDEKNQ